MKGGTHLIAGAAVGLALARWHGLDDPGAVAAVVGVSSLASLVPDWLQVNVPALGKTIKGAFGHRGFSHWFLTDYLVWWAVGNTWPAASASVPQALPAAAGLGWLSHIVLDAFNSPGVPAFWPLPWRLHLASLETGGTVDQIAAYIFGVLAVWGAVGIFL